MQCDRIGIGTKISCEKTDIFTCTLRIRNSRHCFQITANIAIDDDDDINTIHINTKYTT